MYVQIHDTHMYTHMLNKHRAGKFFYDEVISI